MQRQSLEHATDDHLVAEVPRLANSERASAADFVEHLAEFDRRKLYLGLGFGSIYSYCAARPRLTEGAAYRRIEAARASREFPAVLQMLRDGRLSLATAALLRPKLTAVNAEALLREVECKSKREVEAILARRNPQPPVPSVVRKLPQPKAPAPTAVAADVETEPAVNLADLIAAPPSRRPVIAPLSEAHYKLQVTISAEARRRLQQIQDLMRHRLPSGDPAAIVERALEVLHAELLKTKAAEVARPRGRSKEAGADSRHIPASVKRAAWSFITCSRMLAGGDATVSNIEMRCRAHNGFEWTRQLDQVISSAAP